MQQANPRTKRNKRIHFVWFVDASQTKSTSFSLRALALSGMAGFLFLSAAAASLFLYADQVRSVRRAAEHVKDLKTGILAQAMVYEHALSTSGREDDRAGLATRTLAVEKEIAAHGKAAVRMENRDGEEAEKLGKVSSSLTNLDNATLNLVAAGAGQDETGSPTSAQATASGKEVGLAAKAVPPQGAELVGNAALAGGPVPAARAATAAPPQSPAPLSKEGSPQTRALVQFENVALVPGKAVSTPSPGPADDALASEPALEAASEPASGSVITFQLVNAAPSLPLSGRVCAVATVLGEGGSPTYEASPGSLSVAASPSGGLEPKPGCRGGQIVRFARLRPTAFAFQADPKRILSVSLYFSTSPTAPFQTHVWKNPAAPSRN